VGVPVAEVLSDPAFAALVGGSRRGSSVFTTRFDLPFIQWRYGGTLLDYRAVVDRGGAGRGVAFVRLRRRGPARETVLAGLFTADGSVAARRSLVREVFRSVRRPADYVLGVGKVPGCVRVPSFGPVVTTRDLATAAPRELTSFDFTLGDLELF
jgi:hypothetical protein